MHPDDLSSALALLRLPLAGARTVERLLAAAPSPREALRLSPESCCALGLRPETAAALRALRGRPDPESERQRDWILQSGVEVLVPGDGSYPALLAAIPDPPPLLFLRGARVLAGAAQVALVGSRRPTPAGRELAAEIAADLAKYGLTVCSGLAAGIDAAAHWGALRAGGQCVAVMGTGPERIYPASNRALAEAILGQGGALLTEFPPGVAPEAANFPRRNRIISGLSLGVLVVEAALPSGSLITAQQALRQDREVMAVPGPVRSPTSRGCHQLIREGAALVESAEDVIRALGDRFQPAVLPAPANRAAAEPRDAPELGEDDVAVLDATGHDPTPVDRVVARAGLAAERASAALVRLELAGFVERVPGGYARRG